MKLVEDAAVQPPSDKTTLTYQVFELHDPSNKSLQPVAFQLPMMHNVMLAVSPGDCTPLPEATVPYFALDLEPQSWREHTRASTKVTPNIKARNPPRAILVCTTDVGQYVALLARNHPPSPTLAIRQLTAATERITARCCCRKG